MSNEQRLSALYSLILVVATVALGWITLRNPSISGVADNRSSSEKTADEQDVVARLWEDPLQAIQASLPKPDHDSPADSTNAAGVLRHSVKAMQAAVLLKADTYKICLLVVPVPETPFPDDVETRLRLRYS